MKKLVDGVLMDMTPEEEQEVLKRQEQEEKYLQNREPTPEEKIAELEKQVTDLSTTLVNQI